MKRIKMNLQLFAGTTKLNDLINPEVMADMISAGLPKAIKFAPLAKIDTTLAAQPGNTITVPRFAYIGDAIDVAEGVAIGTTILTASSTTATVKKAGKAIELTDESLLSGYGDPAGESQKQLKMAISSKIDNDCYEALAAAPMKYNGSAAIIGYGPIVDAIGIFGEEDYSKKVMFVHPNQVTQLRKDTDFIDYSKYPSQDGGVVMSGVIGMIAGTQIIPSKKVANTAGVYQCPIVKVTTNEEEEGTSALTIYMKRDVQVESDRDILAKTTVISVDEHYAAVLSNDSKVVLAQFKA